MKNGDTAEVYVVKHALKAGVIVKVKGQVRIYRQGFLDEKSTDEPQAGDIVYFTTQFGYVKLGTEAFLTEQEAITGADKKRAKRLKSLQKQIDALNSLSWQV